MILQWVVNEGHLMESGGQATVFFSGGPDPNHQSSDAMHIDPLADRQSSLRLRKAVYCLINAALR